MRSRLTLIFSKLRLRRRRPFVADVSELDGLGAIVWGMKPGAETTSKTLQAAWRHREVDHTDGPEDTCCARYDGCHA